MAARETATQELARRNEAAAGAEAAVQMPKPRCQQLAADL